jgi:hypothetical protein
MSCKTNSATYTITPMYYGRFPSYEKSILQFFMGYGVKVDSPSLGFLIRGNGKNIVVDTGPGRQEDMERLHPGLPIDFPEDVNVVTAIGIPRIIKTQSRPKTIMVSANIPCSPPSRKPWA